MDDKQKIFLDQEGYQEHLNEIERLKGLLASNSRQKSSAYTNAVGDGWHDNFEFEQAKRDEYKILCDLHNKIEELNRIVIIDKKGDSSSVDIGDYLLVSIEYGEDDIVDEAFKLIGGESPKFDLEIPEITVNSPLGKTVYQQKVGYKGQYQVQSNSFAIEIKKIAKTVDELFETEQRKKGR